MIKRKGMRETKRKKSKEKKLKEKGRFRAIKNKEEKRMRRKKE